MSPPTFLPPYLHSIEGISLTSQKPFFYSLHPPSGITVIIFLSTLCPCSQSHEKSIKALAKAFSSVTFLGIATDSKTPLEALQQYFQKNNLGFDVIKDNRTVSGKPQYADFFQALKTPHAFIINKERQILYQGGIDNSHTQEKATQFGLKNALEDINANRPVKEPLQKTFGCYIEH